MSCQSLNSFNISIETFFLVLVSGPHNNHKVSIWFFLKSYISVSSNCIDIFVISFSPGDAKTTRVWEEDGSLFVVSLLESLQSFWLGLSFICHVYNRWLPPDFKSLGLLLFAFFFFYFMYISSYLYFKSSLK